MSNPRNNDLLKAIVSERGLPDKANSVPVLIVNSSFYTDYDDIAEAAYQLAENGSIKQE